MHWRITRPSKYGQGTPGQADHTARQGYYVDANTREEATQKVREQNKFDSNEPLDVELWGV